MRAYNALPDAGGLLDQEERLMRILDIISDEYAKWEKRKPRPGPAADRKQFRVHRR